MAVPSRPRTLSSSRLFWKLFASFAGLTVFAGIAFGLLAYAWRDGQQFGAVGGIAIFIGFILLAVTYWIVRRIVQPIQSLSRAADAIASGHYDHRVYVPNRDELGSLAGTFNRISEDLASRMTQLNRSRDRQTTVLDGMIEGVIAVDARQRIVLANPAAGRLFGFRPPAAEGRPLLEVIRNHAVHEAVMTALAMRIAQRLETKSNIQHPASNIQHRTSSIQHPASTPQHVNIHIQPLPGEPCPGAVLVMHDTTELRRLESLRRDFMANVSHELKTPLSSIKAYTETLRNGAVDDAETRSRFLQRIEEQSERLHHLIMDMLMLARIESDQQAFEIVSVDVAAVAQSCIDNRRQAAEAKRIALAIAPDQPTSRVRADLEGLREIVDNLIDNAIKYTPEGGSVAISWTEIGARPSAADGARGPARSIQHPASSIQQLTPDTRHPTPDTQSPTLRIAVHDSGIGIKPEDQRRVFERFYRVDKARSRELGGTGLGLAIVKHLAQSFGGNVSVTSEPGKGSTFTVELPIA
jgi:two-component system phosphate regulon sensor histidine kinase PhoR